MVDLLRSCWLQFAKTYLSIIHVWLFDADMKLWILTSVFYYMCYDFTGLHGCLATSWFGLVFIGLVLRCDWADVIPTVDWNLQHCCQLQNPCWFNQPPISRPPTTVALDKKLLFRVFGSTSTIQFTGLYSEHLYPSPLTSSQAQTSFFYFFPSSQH